MDSQTFGLAMAAFLLVVTSGTSAFALGRRGNYLLSALWLLPCLSGASYLLFGLYGILIAHDISRLCDEILMVLGMPLIATAGLMAATHDFKPSKRISTVFLIAVLAAVALLELADSVFRITQALSLGMWLAFSIYLWYFARCLVRVGEFAHAAGIVAAVLSAQTVIAARNLHGLAGIGASFNVQLFEILACTFMCAQMFLAYRALEQFNERA